MTNCSLCAFLAICRSAQLDQILLVIITPRNVVTGAPLALTALSGLAASKSSKNSGPLYEQIARIGEFAAISALKITFHAPRAFSQTLENLRVAKYYRNR